jgi:hypothetical protein
MYSIYHIPGIKIGCSKRVEQRVMEQGYSKYDLLEVHSDIDTASLREKELQKEYGYRIDNVEYNKTNYVQLGKNVGKKNVESGHMTKIQSLGGIKTALLGTGIHTFKNRSKWGNINVTSGLLEKIRKIGGTNAQSIIRNCPHCNTEMKGSIYFRYHGDKCKYA